MEQPTSLSRDISPPPTRRTSNVKVKKVAQIQEYNHESHGDLGDSRISLAQPSLAAIEAGEARIQDHLAYFSERLASSSRPTPPNTTRLSMDDFQRLYNRNQHEQGRHFVIHQHDHPISGSFARIPKRFAIPYGMPGNPNSIRPNRMAIETRVHNLWNNLIESASHSTGSLLIWDTGEYEVLPYREEPEQRDTETEMSDDENSARAGKLSDSEKLFAGFQSRHLRLRLHGTRLPRGYTIGLRLPSANDKDGQPRKPRRKRRRTDPAKMKKASLPVETDSESGDQSGTTESSTTAAHVEDVDEEAAVASEAEDVDATIRGNNAYIGASNTIGSTHQRHWFVTLDRKRSGFRKARNGPDEGRWVGDWESFHVMGREVERSLITGRLADDVMADEHVANFVGRKMWRPITE